jgi:mono/diheme cytochrome c family protein
VRRILVILGIFLIAGTVQAQDKEITLVSDPELEASGLWAYVLPRFKLKTGIKVHVIYGTSDTDGDMILSQEGTTPVMVRGDGLGFRATLNRSSPHGKRFMEWLTSEVGQRTISAFRQGDRQVFFPSVVEVTEDVAQLEGNVTTGEETSIAKCGRCHVISERNKYGGIDSTPSFGALRTLVDWQERFRIFWTLNPHPSFTQIEGVTKPFDPAYPPHIYPIFLTVEEVSDIGAYMQTITPKDLGPLLEGE